MSIGMTDVCVNPSVDSPPPQAPTISIATEDLNLRSGQQVLDVKIISVVQAKH